VTFEGDPERLPQLQRNLNANGDLAQRVQVVPEFVGTGALALDSFANGGPPTFIKIDVEGAERDVLESARRTLEQHRPISSSRYTVKSRSGRAVTSSCRSATGPS
jgi:hypothetical protein